MAKLAAVLYGFIAYLPSSSHFSTPSDLSAISSSEKPLIQARESFLSRAACGCAPVEPLRLPAQPHGPARVLSALDQICSYQIERSTYVWLPACAWVSFIWQWRQ